MLPHPAILNQIRAAEVQRGLHLAGPEWPWGLRRWTFAQEHGFLMAILAGETKEAAGSRGRGEAGSPGRDCVCRGLRTEVLGLEV